MARRSERMSTKNTQHYEVLKEDIRRSTVHSKDLKVKKLKHKYV